MKVTRQPRTFELDPDELLSIVQSAVSAVSPGVRIDPASLLQVRKQDPDGTVRTGLLVQESLTSPEADAEVEAARLRAALPGVDVRVSTESPEPSPLPPCGQEHAIGASAGPRGFAVYRVACDRPRGHEGLCMLGSMALGEPVRCKATRAYSWGILSCGLPPGHAGDHVGHGPRFFETSDEEAGRAPQLPSEKALAALRIPLTPQSGPSTENPPGGRMRRLSVSFVLSVYDDQRHAGGTPSQLVVDWTPGLTEADPELVSLLRRLALEHLKEGLAGTAGARSPAEPDPSTENYMDATTRAPQAPFLACADRKPSGESFYVCHLPTGHEGPHSGPRATGGGVATWPQAPGPQVQACGSTYTPRAQDDSPGAYTYSCTRPKGHDGPCWQEGARGIEWSAPPPAGSGRCGNAWPPRGINGGAVPRPLYTCDRLAGHDGPHSEGPPEWSAPCWHTGDATPFRSCGFTAYQGGRKHVCRLPHGHAGAHAGEVDDSPPPEEAEIETRRCMACLTRRTGLGGYLDATCNLQLGHDGPHDFVSSIADAPKPAGRADQDCG